MNEFWAKYRDPRWQKVRLEKMQEAEFTCEHCHDSQSTLNVHHKIYRKGRDPWEYPLTDLECLCETCHEEHHELKDSLKEALAQLDPYAHQQVLGYVQAVLAMCYQNGGPQKFKVISPMHASGISDAASYTDDSEILDMSLGGKPITSAQLWDLQQLRRKRAIGEV